jgi:hypothetical protein
MSDELPSFRHELQEHVISVSTMGRGVRIAFAAGLVSVVIPMLLSLARGHLGEPALTIFFGTKLPVAMEVSLYLAELLITVFGFYGLILMRGRYRLVAFTVLAVALLLAAVGTRHPRLAWPVALPLLSLPVCWAAIDWRDMFRRLAAVLAILLAIEFFTVILYSAVSGAADILYSLFFIQVTLAIFGLCMVATDIAEIASVGGHIAVERLSGLRGTRLAAVATFAGTACLSLLVAWSLHRRFFGTLQGNLEAIAVAFAALVLVVGILWRLFRDTGKLPEHIAYRTLFLIVAANIVAYAFAITWCISGHSGSSCPKVQFVTPMALAALAFAVALILHRGAPRRATALLYGVLTGAWSVLLQTTPITYFAVAITGAGAVFVLCAAAFPSLRFSVWAVVKATAKLNFCIAVFLIVSWIATQPEVNHELNLLNVAIALVALTWDIMTSGGGITNRQSDHLPRSARIALFFAYVMTTSLQVAISATGEMAPRYAHASSLFETESLMSAGLGLFAAPFFLWLFVIDIRNAVWDPKAAAEKASARSLTNFPTNA